MKTIGTDGQVPDERPHHRDDHEHDDHEHDDHEHDDHEHDDHEHDDHEHDDHEHDDREQDEHDLGLAHDLSTVIDRRRLLGLFGGAGVALALAACGAGDDTGSAATSTSASGAASRPGGGAPPGGASGAGGAGESSVDVGEGEIPQETAGPFPGDGSNGVNVLTSSGIVRSDLTRSFGSGSGVATGVPVTVRLRVLDLSDDAKPLAGAAVYLWHCTSDGEYSLYADTIRDENYLRGVQAADAQGRVTFTTIFPGAYSGRWPHMHFEVYPGLDTATSATSKLRTSQLALPEDACRAVYATDGYGDSLGNLERTSLDSDNVFGDGWSLQLATLTGSVASGYTASLTVPV